MSPNVISQDGMVDKTVNYQYVNKYRNGSENKVFNLIM